MTSEDDILDWMDLLVAQHNILQFNTPKQGHLLHFGGPKQIFKRIRYTYLLSKLKKIKV